MSDPLEHELISSDDEEDLWLISYADLLTLLIAFFALALAGSASNSKALERAAEALGMNSQHSLKAVRKDLEALAKDPSLQGARITDDATGVSLVLGDALLFDLGSAELRPDARASLGRIAAVLERLDGRHIVVEGHTDDLPIHSAVHLSNWDLSAARALSVVRVLEESGVPHQRLSFNSFADTRPATTEGPLDTQRAANRRVVIRVE